MAVSLDIILKLKGEKNSHGEVEEDHSQNQNSLRNRKINEEKEKKEKVREMDLFQEEKNPMNILFENVVPIFCNKIQHYSLFCLVENRDSAIFEVSVLLNLEVIIFFQLKHSIKHQPQHRHGTRYWIQRSGQCSPPKLS